MNKSEMTNRNIFCVINFLIFRNKFWPEINVRRKAFLKKTVFGNGFVSLFNGISNFVVYLMPKPF